MSFENRDEDKTVTDSEQQRPEATTDEKDAMRPIPDGGLQQSMPEWLRRPPAWRNLPKRDVPVPNEAAATPEATSSSPEKELPEPDRSEIDPRSLVDLGDLPQWLQDVAARSDARIATAAEPVTTESEPAKEPEMTDQDNRTAAETGTERSVQFEPVKKGAMDAPEHETKTYGGGAPKQGMSPIMMGIIALAIVVIVALILLAIL